MWGLDSDVESIISFIYTHVLVHPIRALEIVTWLGSSVFSFISLFPNSMNARIRSLKDFFFFWNTLSLVESSNHTHRTYNNIDQLLPATQHDSAFDLWELQDLSRFTL